MHNVSSAGADLDNEHASAQLVWIDVRDSGDMTATFGHDRYLDVYAASAWKAEVHGQNILGAIAAPRVDQTASQDRSRSRRVNAHLRACLSVTASLIEYANLERSPGPLRRERVAIQVVRASGVIRQVQRTVTIEVGPL